MSTLAAPSHDGATRFEADRCDACGGVWFDGAELNLVRPELSAARARDAAAPSAIPRCPRCQSSMAIFPFHEMLLDTCGACSGVWVDGPELRALSQSLDHARGLPAPAPADGSPFRTAAVSAMRGNGVLCRSCKQMVPRETTLLDGEGAVCDRCRAWASSTDDPEVDELETKLRNGMVGTGGTAAETATEMLAGLGNGLLMILTFGQRCRHCGCLTTSGCGH
jgi:Zn-finger nucleic acid-binding protein